MEQFIIYLSLILFGSCLGSFAGASVWRLRARQLAEDKAAGERVSAKEYDCLKKLIGPTIIRDRSRCLNCSYILRWYDLIPLFSWLSLGGKCRKCRAAIGYMEPMIELGVAAFFVLSYALWPYSLNNGLEIARFILWLAAGIGLAIMFIYDIKWSLLPDVANFAVIAIGICSAVLAIAASTNYADTLAQVAVSTLILSGLYWVLHRISHGRWIGFGDVKLGLGMALLLADWELAFVALFAANLIGCIIVLPGMVTGKLKRNSHVPFGPLLIVGLIVAQLFGGYLVNIYVSSLI